MPPEFEKALAPHMVVPRAGDDVFGRLCHADLAPLTLDGALRIAVGHEMRVVHPAHLPHLLLAEKSARHKAFAPHPVHKGRHGLFLVDGKGHHPVGPHIVGQPALKHHGAVAVIAVRGYGGFIRHDLACRSWGSDRPPVRHPIRERLGPVPPPASPRRPAAGPPERRNGKTGHFHCPAIGVKVQIAAAAGAFVGDACHIFTSLAAPWGGKCMRGHYTIGPVGTQSARQNGPYPVIIRSA